MLPAQRLPGLLECEYHSSLTPWLPFVFDRNDSGFAILAGPTPRKKIARQTIIMGTFFFGLSLAPFKASDRAFFVAFIIVLGIFTVGGLARLQLYGYEKQQKLGAVLAYDRQRRVFVLKRRQRQIPLAAVACICLVADSRGDDWVVQMQLHTIVGERFLLIEANRRQALDPIFQLLAAEVEGRFCHYTKPRGLAGEWLEQDLSRDMLR